MNLYKKTIAVDLKISRKTNRRDGKTKRKTSCRDGNLLKIDMRDKWMQSIYRKKKRLQTNR